jgi:tRNA 2-selenouridine synthase
VGTKKNTGLHPSGLHPTGWSPLGPKEFLERSLSIPVIDVRAPKEFRQGHIPGALSMPLFDDEERAIVGTTYSRTGKDVAVMKGLEIVGPKLPEFTRKAKEYAKNGELLVHCWRGGMRSEAMAWLFGFSGIKTAVLEGGYRAYRHCIRESFQQGPPIIVLGGMTGSGKTELLHHLSSQGEQVIDLEGLANHRGSAFGSLGQPDQPTTEQFENNLASLWLALDPQKPVWLEDESRNIGRVILPDLLFNKMIAAPLVFIDLPFEIRVKRLTEEYGNFATDDLIELISKIGRRMGGDQANTAIKALEQGNVSEAVAIVLHYYDKSYRYGLSKRRDDLIHTIKAGNEDLFILSKLISGRSTSK